MTILLFRAIGYTNNHELYSFQRHLVLILHHRFGVILVVKIEVLILSEASRGRNIWRMHLHHHHSAHHPQRRILISLRMHVLKLLFMDHQDAFRTDGQKRGMANPTAYRQI